MAQSHCSLEYHEESFDTLNDTATGVVKGWFDNSTVFIATAPVTRTVFEAQVSDFVLKYGAYKRGGNDQKGAFLLALGLLMGTMDSFCILVDNRAAGDETIITLGGFKPTKITRTTSTIPGVPVADLQRGESIRTLVSECKVLPGAEFYGAILTTKELTNTMITEGGQLIIAPADFAVIVKIDLKKNRKKTFIGLTTGEVYYIYYFASNVAGVSQLSIVKSMMCG